MTKRFLFALLLTLALSGAAYGQDKKVTELTEDTAPTFDDLLVTVNDPAGTPATRKAKILNAAGREVNSQTGTTYTVLTGDFGKLVSFSNASAVAVTLPQANSSTFPAKWHCLIQNRGAGAVTVTPTTSTIDGAASLTLAQNEGAAVVSDGTNYFTFRGKAASTGMSNPMTTAGDIIYGGASGSPTRLAAGTNGHVLTLSGGNPTWAAASGGSAADFLSVNREWAVHANPNATTVATYGAAAVTPTQGGTAASADDSEGIWRSATTGTSSGGIAQVPLGNLNLARKEWNPVAVFRIKTPSDITSVRFWFGFTSADPTASSTPDVHGAMVRYDTGVDGTAFWRFYTEFNGNAGSAETTATTQSIAADTVYVFKVALTSTTAALSVWNGSSWDVLATHSSILPNGVMGFYASVTTLTAANRTLKFGWAKGRQDK